MRVPVLIALLAAAPAHAREPLHLDRAVYAVGDEGTLTASLRADLRGTSDAGPLRVRASVDEAARWRVTAVEDGVVTGLDVTWLVHRADHGGPGTAPTALHGRHLQLVRGEHGDLTFAPDDAAAVADELTLVPSLFTTDPAWGPVDYPDNADLPRRSRRASRPADAELWAAKATRRFGHRVIELLVDFPVGVGDAFLPAKAWMDAATGRLLGMRAAGSITVAKDAATTMRGAMKLQVIATHE